MANPSQKSPAYSVLVTGGCGFLGSHLCERYVREGAHVLAVDNFASGFRPNAAALQALGVQVLESDVICDWSPIAAIKWPAPLRYVLHFASPASPPHFERLNLEIMAVNSVGLARALEFADAHKARCIFASTSEVYGDPQVTPQQESYRGNVNTWGPRACYDESKRFGEALIYSHNKRHKTTHGAVRIFNTYGPRMNPQDGRVLTNFLVQAIEGEALTIFGDGKQTRSFCYVDDLIEGIYRYAASEHCHPINIGNGREFTILEAAEIVKRLFPEKKLTHRFEPLPKDDPLQRCPDTTQAKQLLSWEPKVPLEEGLRKMLSWMQSL